MKDVWLFGNYSYLCRSNAEKHEKVMGLTGFDSGQKW